VDDGRETVDQPPSFDIRLAATCECWHISHFNKSRTICCSRQIIHSVYVIPSHAKFLDVSYQPEKYRINNEKFYKTILLNCLNIVVASLRLSLQYTFINYQNRYTSHNMN
jgi:hypothetical protein